MLTVDIGRASDVAHVPAEMMASASCCRPKRMSRWTCRLTALRCRPERRCVRLGRRRKPELSDGRVVWAAVEERRVVHAGASLCAPPPCFLKWVRPRPAKLSTQMHNARFLVPWVSH